MVEGSRNVDDQPIIGKKREKLPWDHDGDLVDASTDQTSQKQVLTPEEERDHGDGPITTLKGTKQPY